MEPGSFSCPQGNADFMGLILVGGEMKMLAIHRSFLLSVTVNGSPADGDPQPSYLGRATHGRLRPTEGRNQLAGAGSLSVCGSPDTGKLIILAMDCSPTRC